VKIIITGGATGIGKSCVQTFHENTDVEIHLIYHSSEESAKQLEGKYIKIHKIDVTNETEISNFFDSIGNFDGLINNAGGNISFNQTYEYSTEDWNKTFELNTLSVFLMCKYGIPHINDGGTIVNISSISAKTGFELTNNVELAVEINEKDGTITSSPWPILYESRVACSADVPELSVKQ